MKALCVGENTSTSMDTFQTERARERDTGWKGEFQNLVRAGFGVYSTHAAAERKETSPQRKPLSIYLSIYQSIDGRMVG